MIPPRDIKSSGGSDVKAVPIRHKSFRICPHGMVNVPGGLRPWIEGSDMVERRERIRHDGGRRRSTSRTVLPSGADGLDAMTRRGLFGADRKAAGSSIGHQGNRMA
jgi:hypothetical protein